MPEVIELKKQFRGVEPKTLIDPELFKIIFVACRTSLQVSQNSSLMRSRVLDLAIGFRRQNLALNGHENGFEEQALAALLRDTSDVRPMVTKSRETPTDRLYRLHVLTSDELHAADMIAQVWAAFHKFLGVRTSNYERSGGTNSGTAQTIPGMSYDLYWFYTTFYMPWYDKCRSQIPITTDKGRKLRPIDVVIHIIVGLKSLDELAKAYSTTQQHIIEILKAELISLSSRMENNDQSQGNTAYASPPAP